MSPSEVHVTGHCYCGAITFAVDIPAGAAPIFTAYCHCDSCRRAHSAPLYQIACVDESMFSITTGEDVLVEFKKPGGTITRAFCGACGSRVLNRFGTWRPRGQTPVGFFPNLLTEEAQRALPEALRPHRDYSPKDSVLDRDLLMQHFEGTPAS